MDSGYVYILINKSFFDLIKIGKTVKDPKDRARQLSSTGVPTPFKVAYSIFTEAMSDLENVMHTALDEYRVEKNREFFSFPLDEAINLLQIESKKFKNTDIETFDITLQIRDKYHDYLLENLASINILKKNCRVYYEILIEDFKAGYLYDEHIHRYDLGFVVTGTGQLFRFEDQIQVIANDFVDLDPFSMLNIASEMFDAKKLEDVYIDENWDPKGANVA